ncbi:hypothetical protein EBU94_02900 [bacterium]|jgi:hypothetical protein|nr:hypothetical protein [bacterium]NBO36672.1 hypothetical protein [bacterium]
MKEYSFWVEGETGIEASQKIRDIVQRWFGLPDSSCISFNNGLIFVDCCKDKNSIGGNYDIKFEKLDQKPVTNVFLRLRSV